MNRRETVRRRDVASPAVQSRGAIRLTAPGCEVGCSDCVRSCAVATIQLAWWAREADRLFASPPADPDSLVADLAEADDQVARLRADLERVSPSPIAAFQSAYCAGRKRSCLN